jgi:hypothetical protein
VCFLCFCFLLPQIDANVSSAEKALKEAASTNNADNEAIAKLTRAAVFRARGEDKAAAMHFEAAAKARVANEHYVVPFATFELALLDLKNGHVTNAMTLMKRALGYKQRYFFEVRLQFRADAATRLLNDVVKKVARKSAASG